MMQYDGGNTMTASFDLAAKAQTLETTLETTAQTLETTLETTAQTLETTAQTTSVNFQATVGVPLNCYLDTLPISWGIEIIPLPIIAYQNEYGRLIYEEISN